MIPQHLLIDADDTLWENNIYFEQAFHQFCEFLDHSHLTAAQVRSILDEIELVNIQVHGYGSANFGRNMVECYHKLVEREVSAADAGHIIELARAINDHPLEIISGVPETLAYLSSRHTLYLLTKGNHEEQQRKVDQSGFHAFFREVIIVKEKDAAAYRNVLTDFALDPALTWMIGNSPKSDINPALEAGIGAVFVPHDRTWHLEHQEIQAGVRLLVARDFSELQDFSSAVQISANAADETHRSESMDIVQSSLEGLLRAEAAVGRAATRIAKTPLSLTGEPNDIVDLSAEAVALMEAKNAFSANIKAAEAGQELAESTLNLLG